MATSSPSLSGQIAVEVHPARRLLSQVGEFLVRRRILLSAIVFAVMVVKDVVYGFKPHDLANIRDPYSVLGVLLIVVGLAIRSWSVGILHKNARLTTTGPYALIRNPLYVGSFFMMFGFCALLNNPGDLWFILGPVLLLYVVKVRQEERHLARIFPDDWPAYFATTPRFIPRLARTDLRADWRLSQWMHTREYRALAASALALVALQLWQAYG